jgi:hypothetical protein
MPCRRCVADSSEGGEDVDDPSFPMAARMFGVTGPLLRMPKGFGPVRICGLCGVVFCPMVVEKIEEKMG